MPAPVPDPPEMDQSTTRMFNHPRPRTVRHWRAEVELVRVEARVTLDAFVTGRLVDTPELAERLRWLVRVAIEYRKMLVRPQVTLNARMANAWVFRPFTEAHRAGSWHRVPRAPKATGKKARGDVFCLFCHEPLRQDTPRYGNFTYPMEIDYGKLRDVHAHTTKCALLFLAGMTEGAPWGSVTFPDPDAPL